jgi:hypothetical protein
MVPPMPIAIPINEGNPLKLLVRTLVLMLLSQCAKKKERTDSTQPSASAGSLDASAAKERVYTNLFFDKPESPCSRHPKTLSNCSKSSVPPPGGELSRATEYECAEYRISPDEFEKCFQVANPE